MSAEIGSRLYVCETTVKTHVARLLDRWGARDRIGGLVVLAHRAGVARR